MIPPLREKVILTRAFIEKLSCSKSEVVSCDEAMERLMNYDWHKYKELSNVIERAMNLCDDVISHHSASAKDIKACYMGKIRQKDIKKNGGKTEKGQ